jgi:ABC-type transporter Mla subunit MlaD
MRRTVFLALGILEVLVALVLYVFVWQLPGPSDVQDKVGRVERVSRETSQQVQRLRQQVAALRRRRPQMQELAAQLQKQMQTVTRELRDQQIDYDTVRTVSDSLGDVAKGLDGLSDTLDPKGIGQLGLGLKTAADFLDEKVAGAADKAADKIEKSTEALRADTKRLSGLLRAAPLDLKTARDVHDSLAKFGEGLGRMSNGFDAKRLQGVRDGFKGLETALTAGADEVARASGYTYPVVTFNGLRPTIEQKAFWPEGDKIADGLRQAAKGVTTAGKELDALVEDLPKVQASLNESRKIVEQTREALGAALKQQAKVEPLLKSVPEETARLVEELPQIGDALARLLRETARLKDVAALLRDAEKGMDSAGDRWPELRKNLGRSSLLLRTTQGQLKHVLENRAEYEAAMKQTVVLARTFSAALPLWTEQLEEELLEQESSLETLGSSIDEVTAVLPACSNTASQILVTSRLLMALVGLIFALHGTHLILGARLGRRYTP